MLKVFWRFRVPCICLLQGKCFWAGSEATIKTLSVKHILVSTFLTTKNVKTFSTSSRRHWKFSLLPSLTHMTMPHRTAARSVRPLMPPPPTHPPLPPLLPQKFALKMANCNVCLKSEDLHHSMYLITERQSYTVTAIFTQTFQNRSGFGLIV